MSDSTTSVPTKVLPTTFAPTRSAPTWQRLGDRAIRFARPSAPVSARELVRAVRAWPGVVDVVVAAEDVAAYFVDVLALEAMQQQLARHIEELATLVDGDELVREHVLRVVYDGADLDDVARAKRLSREEVIALHSGATYTVDTIGFAPGFAYLAGLDARLELPRRATPRPRVPAGSVAIAGRQSAVYPFDSAGGWHLVGRVVGVSMFGENGALLSLGDRVRFVGAEKPTDVGPK
ncbi:MAG TPA: carboxyltransferase domain-containing protein [Kofleriaceae bacterium]|nr:carboxyltransferase domain-containing protein [Kofleriaceae bacterium]